MENKNEITEKSTEQLILEAATKEFGARGFDGARTTAIATEAGVTHAMLHYYFRTKEKLFSKILEQQVKEIINVVFTPMWQMEGSIKDRIRRGMEAHFDYLNSHRGLPVFFVTTLHSRPDAFKEAIAMIRGAAAERVAAFQRDLDEAHAKGEIVKLNSSDLIGDIASLNLFPFIAYPLTMAVAGYSPERLDEYLDSRKRENIETIMRRIS